MNMKYKIAQMTQIWALKLEFNTNTYDKNICYIFNKLKKFCVNQKT
jgi:hypothetical protein